MNFRLLTLLALGAGTAGAATAETGPYFLGETGGFRLNLDTAGAVTGVNQASYDFSESDTKIGASATLGAGYNFGLGGGPISIGAEGLVSFSTGDQDVPVAAGSSQRITYFRGCNVALNPDGSCPAGQLLPSTFTDVNDVQAFNIETSVDYTAAALLTVGYEMDRLTLTAGAGPATARVNAEYNAAALSTPTVEVNSFDIRTGQGTATLAAESFSEKSSANGWAARIGFDYAATDNISVGLHYQYADFGEADFGGARVSQMSVGALGDMLHFRVKTTF